MALNTTRKIDICASNVLMSEGIIILVLNVTLILIVVRSKEMRKSIGDIVLINLLISHAVEGVFAIWMDVAGIHIHNANKENRQTVVNLFLTYSLFGCLNNLPFTAERVSAIRWPYLHQRLRFRDVLLICCVPWLISCIFLLLAFLLDLPEKTGDVITITLVAIMSLLLIVSNTIIYRVVLKHVKEIKKTTVGIENTVYENQDMPTATVSNNIPIQVATDSIKLDDSPNNDISKSKPELAVLQQCKNTKKSQHEKIEKRRLRSVYICSGIVVSYIVCWFPHMIRDIIYIVEPNFLNLHSRYCFFRYSLVVAFVNPIIDPLVWISLNQKIKKEIKKRFICFKKTQVLNVINQKESKI